MIAYLAQSVERKTFNLVAVGSTPTVGSSRLAQLAEHRSYEPKAMGSRPIPRNPYGAMDNAFDF